MSLRISTVKSEIRAKLSELAADLGNDASELADDDIIPATGLLDSASILELVVWYENRYDLSIKQSDVNIDNLGSVNAMVDFLVSRKAF